MGTHILRFLWVQFLLMTIGSHLLIKVTGKNGMMGLLKIICSMDSGKISKQMLRSFLSLISPFQCLGEVPIPLFMPFLVVGLSR
jgi:hypothetical protein